MVFRAKSATATLAPKADVAFPSDATDTVQAIRWSPTAHCLAAACWDGKVRIYNIASTGTINHAALLAAEGPVFACDFSKDGALVAAGGADKKAHLLDALSGKTMSFEAHAAPLSAMCFVDAPTLSSCSLLATGSWDKTLRYWDLRQTSQPVAGISLDERIYSMDAAGELLAISTADHNRIRIVNLKTNPAAVAAAPPSKLLHQLRFISVSGDGKHWSVGGIEGRCSAGATDEREARTFDFSWRCHREQPTAGPRKDPVKVWAVNAGSYHPHKNNVFATGGADGDINIWDLANHCRLRRLASVGLVTAVAFSRDGTYLAYATGYDWGKGYWENNKEKYPTKLLLHSVTPDDLERS